MKHKLNIASTPLLWVPIALMILGLALAPLLKVKHLPDRILPSVFVYYNYSGANEVVVDSEVTYRLEGVFSNLEG